MKKSIRLGAGVFTRLSAPVLSMLSLACASVCAQPVEYRNFSGPLITANRIPQDPTLLPMGVSVITADEIRAAGVTDASDAIRWLGGVVTRIDTTGGRNPTLDLRGFGETASSNLVIMVDGVRQNEGDMGGGSISWLPVDSIERIEIVRGSGTVVHGEGATAGVINVITGRGMSEAGASAAVGAGNMGTRDSRLELRTASENWQHQIYGSALNSNNHRENFRVQERNVLARTTWFDGDKTISAQLGVQSQQGGLPGGLNVAEFKLNPYQSFKPSDKGNTETANFLLSAELPLADWRLGLDLSERHVKSTSEYVADGYTTDSQTARTRAGIRAWKNNSFGLTAGRFLMGVDAEHWCQDKATLDPVWGNTNVRIAQASEALYVRQELEWRNLGMKAFAGARHTQSYREAKLDSVGTLDAKNNSWEVGVAQRIAQNSELYARIGTSFRLPNADEFSCSFGCPPSTLNLLNPQTSKDYEIGYRQKYVNAEWAARYYRNDLRNEIGLGADFMTNMNYDPTRREGIELEAKTKLTPSIRSGLQFAQRQSNFREGQYQGKTVPLTPSQSLTANVQYQMNATQQVVLLTQWVSSQKIAGDLDNTCSQNISGYGLTNLRFNQKMDAWLISGQVSNLFDRQYYDYRSRCDATKRSIYPQLGRAWLVTARRNF